MPSLKQADVDVALVVADPELAADLDAVVRQAAALRVRRDDAEDRRAGGLVGLARQRLRDLAVVAVEGDRLDAELPGVDVELRITSSTVVSSGTFTVFEIAPEMNGWMAPIIFTWPE